MKYYPRNKQETDKEAGGNSGKIYFLKKGKSVIRILPPFSDRGTWFRKFDQYTVKVDGKVKNFISNRNVGTDPIWEHGKVLYQEHGAEASKNFRPRSRAYVNALIIQDPEGKVTVKDGVKIVQLPSTVLEKLKKFDDDAANGYDDITNPEAGFNISIEREGVGLNTEYTPIPQRDRTNILDFAKSQGVNVEDLKLHNLDEAVKPNSEEELEGLLSILLEESEGALVDAETGEETVVSTEVKEDLVPEVPPPTTQGVA